MNVVRGRAEARWLPSRHRFALFRSFAHVKMRTARPEPAAGLMLIVDRDQSAYEHYAVSTWIVLTVACYLAATLFGAWPLPLGFAAGIPASAVAIGIPVAVSGLITGSARANGIAFMLTMIAASAYLATSETWVRFAAWQFLGVVALNAVAAVVLFPLERGAPSAA